MDGPALMMFQGKYEAAKAQVRKALELDPSFYVPQVPLGYVDLEAGKFKEATAELEKATAIDSPPFVAGLLGYAYAKAGERAKAEAIIMELNQMSPRRYVSPFCTGIIYLGLGDKQRALERLEETYEVRSQFGPGLRSTRSTTHSVPSRALSSCGKKLASTSNARESRVEPQRFFGA
jgi:tetratricopeptide (TPR) repeat protein